MRSTFARQGSPPDAPPEGAGSDSLGVQVSLYGGDQARENALWALAGRIIAAQAADPAVEWDAAKIATKVGVRTEEVFAVFAQSWFGEMLQRHAQGAAMRLWGKAVDTLDDLMGPEQRSDIRLRAAAAVFTVSKLVAEMAPKSDAPDAEKAALDFLAKMRRAKTEVREAVAAVTKETNPEGQ